MILKHFVSIGETMVSFVPDRKSRLKYGSTLQMRIAGAESNTAIGLQNLGFHTGWISKLGTDSFGDYILRQIRAENVDTSQVTSDELHPTGIMFREYDHNNTIVHYYRQHSAASFLSPKDIDEEYIKDSKILHFTGITPILSDSCKQAIYKAIDIAKTHNVLISFDPNIRRKLWKNNNYASLMKEFIALSDIVLIGLEEAYELYDTMNQDEIFHLLQNYDATKYLAIKNGKEGAWVSDKNEFIMIPPSECNCVDPIGAGDAFNAGFISGILQGKSLFESGTLGGLAGAYATETEGDIESLPTKKDIHMLLNQLDKVYR